MLVNSDSVVFRTISGGSLLMVNEDNLITQQEEKKENESEEVKSTIQEPEEDMSFVELYEKSLQDVATGKIVVGRIVQINDDVVMIDVGYKTEGRLNINECKDENGEVTVSIGDEIEVFVDRKREDDLILSREKASKLRVWDDIISAYNSDGTVEGTVVRRVKGGLSVDIGFLAFLPGSQIDVHPVKDLDRYVGQTLDFQVLKYDRKRNNVVLSRKSILEREREDKKKQILETIEVGKVVEGIVKNITDYGIFIDLGGIDGLLHVTDMSWGRIRHPSESFSREDKITVKILSFDREKERVSLGLKQLTENPWSDIAGRYTIGDVVEGTIVSLTDYGAFVELESGVEGLIHVSEMFWTKKIRHPSKIVSVGDVVKVMVLDVNSESKRVSLGLKQTMENPWVALRENYPVGTVVGGKVRNVTDFGIFIGIEDDIDGLIHVSDISWKKRVKNPSEMYKKGQEIEAIGSVIQGKVTNVTEFGIFVEIEQGIEGLVHISEISHERVKSAKDLYSVGNVISAAIKNIDVENQKVGLSIKDCESASDNSSQNQYVNNKEKVVSNLGEILSGIKV
jgi:small subunit ribosomal protein S1